MPVRLRSLALLPALPLAACGSDTTGPDVDDRAFGGGSLSASYSGDRAGALNANGTLTFDSSGNVKPRSYVIGIIDTANPDNRAMSIIAVELKSGDRADYASFAVFDRPLGTYTFGDGCFGNGNVTSCALGVVTLDVALRDDTGDDSNAYRFTEGQLRVSRLTATEAEGSFSGIAYPSDQSGTITSGRALVVKDGKSNIKLTDIADLPVNDIPANAIAARLAPPLIR